MPGRVVLVGAGPGDPDLLTVRAMRELRHAEVLLYDALIPPALLSLAPDACECIDVGKRGDGTRGVPQERIGALLVGWALEGRSVVRLKGGDPFVFGRGGEEASALVAAGIPFEVVPGVTSPLAVPAYAGIPVTDRRASSSVAVVTGHRAGDDPGGAIDWEGLARSAGTLVVVMATAWLEDIARRIVDGGRDPRTPAAAIENGTTPRQRVVVAPLGELPARVAEAGLRAPTVIVVGEVVRFRDELRWFEDRPLFGRRVLTFRARERSGALALALLRRGAIPVSIPLIAHEPPTDPEPLRCALRDGGHDWWAFTSATAVQFVCDALDQVPSVPVACIGSATAEAARTAGFQVAAVPSGAALPSDLVRAMASVAPLGGARVLFPAAERARQALGSALEEAGARVDQVVAYRTVLPEQAGSILRTELDLGVDAITFTSSSTVEHLVQVIGQGALVALAERTVLAAIGPTTAASLKKIGVEMGVVSDRQTSEDLAEALERHFSEARHGVS